MSLKKDVSLRVDVKDELEDLNLYFKTVGDKIYINCNIPGLFDPKEVLDALTSCIEFQTKLKAEKDGNTICTNVHCICEQPCSTGGLVQP